MQGSVHTSGAASAPGSVDHSSAEAFVTGAGAGSMGKHGKTGSTNGFRQIHMKNGSIVKGLYGEQGREYDHEEKKSISTHDAAARLGQQQQHLVSSHKAYKRTWYGKKVSVQGDPALEFGSLGRDGSYDSTAFGTDEESGLGNAKRPVRLYASLYSGLAAGLAVLFVGNGLRTLLIEWRLDGGFVRFALLGALPLLYCVSLVRCDKFKKKEKADSRLFALVLHFADYPECNDDVCLSFFSPLSLSHYPLSGSVPSRTFTKTPSTTPLSNPHVTRPSTTSCRTSPSRCLCTRRASRAFWRHRSGA
jgi:hypothetical protein